MEEAKLQPLVTSVTPVTSVELYNARADTQLAAVKSAPNMPSSPAAYVAIVEAIDRAAARVRELAERHGEVELLLATLMALDAPGPAVRAKIEHLEQEQRRLRDEAWNGYRISVLVSEVQAERSRAAPGTRSH